MIVVKPAPTHNSRRAMARLYIQKLYDSTILLAKHFVLSQLVRPAVSFRLWFYWLLPAA